MNELKNKTYEELIERRGALAAKVDDQDADLGEIEREIRAINEEIERRKAEKADSDAQAAKRAELRKLVAGGAGETRMRTGAEERKPRGLKEIRSSAAYADAWANDVKRGDGRYTETRAILSENADAGNVGEGDSTVPVPTYIEDRINAIFENNKLLNRIHKTFVKANLKVPFVLTADPAQTHAEGGNAPSEEKITFGEVSLDFDSFLKKWIDVSDTVLLLRGEEFMRFIMDEFENKIEAGLAADVIEAVVNAPETSTASAIGVPVYPISAITLDTIVNALALITDDEAKPSLVMNRGTYAAFKATQYNAGYAVDVFEGLEIDFSSKLPSITDAQVDDALVIVGDIYAVQANLPDGAAVKFIVDPYTLATINKVRTTGKLARSVGITKPGRLVKITKAAAE